MRVSLKILGFILLLSFSFSTVFAGGIDCASSCKHAPDPAECMRCCTPTGPICFAPTGMDLLFNPQVPVTQTGIPLDAKWKQQIYEFAQKNVKHPAWGLAHAERDYQSSLTLAGQERLSVDKDVLFAAAFLHDIGGIGAFQKAGVDHAVRSTEIAAVLLQRVGFPMEKWPKVKDVILGHIYYGPAFPGAEATVFRDADILDFLGNIGVARLFSAAEEPGANTPLSKVVGTLVKFANELPPKLTTRAAKAEGIKRSQEMVLFLRTLKNYSFNGKAL